MIKLPNGRVLYNSRRIPHLDDIDINNIQKAVKVANTIGKGSTEQKVQSGLDIAQNLLNQSSGGTGQVSEIAKSQLHKILKVKEGTGSKVGSVAGSAVGTALLGPAGGAVGQILGSIAGGITEDLLGIKGGKQTRLDREVKRENADKARLKLASDLKTDKDFYNALMKGNITFTIGIPGSQKENEFGIFRIVNGKQEKITVAKLYEIFGKQSNGEVKTYKNKVHLGSNKYSQEILKKALSYEEKAKASLTKKEPVKSKPVAVKKLVANTKTTTAKSTMIKPVIKPVVDTKNLNKLQSVVNLLEKKKLSRLATHEHKNIVKKNQINQQLEKNQDKILNELKDIKFKISGKKSLLASFL